MMVRTLLGLAALIGGLVGGYLVLGGWYDVAKYLYRGGPKLGLTHPSTILLAAALLILTVCVALAGNIAWDGVKLLFGL